ncbi:MAG: hypothetical protein COU29_03185 [Candidatus Magasanikbacteria bacterium CG10_big_fil_rev_8_21_14_0_10_36_32]|uniref:Membrane insertase YidC/Oxa/ALB C-terminal domain-containing protein n=1 Tax=Candidatus Magasanikbacteria bacterium CG10_big_fil_rev_8_21_14_0_10_36_32 TaxID=1974646 RepID=A0A2M6W639_9BACT|nr:MAG: hypothetical protein COU29_03185 [Candidatus Magasanikbacteria bacterium CG10_big_fil_rev_8_21_14_0_10_36_32]
MFSFIWFTFLYQPLLNALVWIYNNFSDHSMGWSVIILTVLLRVVLLPFSIVAQRDSGRMQQVRLEATEAVKNFKNDPVAQKEEYRKIMKKNKVSPWAKVVILLIQFIVLILLYQVFMGGIFGDKLVKVLYQGVSFPGAINNSFYGFNIGELHNSVWAGISALYLFLSIIITKGKISNWQKGEVIFLFLFPLFTFTALWILPMVKSLFILTSMIFSDILTFIRVIFSPAKKLEAVEPPVGISSIPKA